jgi:hypothetical protein
MPFGINLSANENLEEQLKKYDQSPEELRKSMLDSSLRRRIQDFILETRDVSLKDFKKFRLIYYASNVLIEDLNKQYESNDVDFRTKIKDEKDKRFYQVAFNLRKKYLFREYYLCKGNETKAMESFKKVQEIRKRRPKPQKTHLEDWIKSYHEILEECRFETGAIDALLDIYRDNKDREKYNDLMLRILKEDQVDYDYLYYPINKINTNLIIQYLFFFTHINPLREKLILTKEQVKFIAEDMLTKHRELLNFKNEYYVRKDNSVDEYHMHDVVNAFICVSTWLREYNFNDELVIDTIRYDPQFKEFMDYLQKWREANGKAEKE